MSIVTGHFIAGKVVRGEGQAFTSVDPRDGRELPDTFHDATPDQLVRTVDLAAQAHRTWRRSPREQRAALLEAIATGIEALGEELVSRAGAETGLDPVRLVRGRARTVDQLRLFARVVHEGAYVDARIDRAQPDRTPMPRPDLRRMLVPIGPVAVFGSSNFPLAFSVAGGDTAAALAAGCPVVFKAHPGHPGTCALVARVVANAVAEVGAPPGLWSCVHGRSDSVGRTLVLHPATRAVAFTGSLEGGQAICDLVAQRPEPIPVFAEMGSINPVLLLPGALAAGPEALAEALFESMMQGLGQLSTKPGLVLVEEGEAAERFIARLQALVDGATHAPMHHARAANAYAAGNEELIETGAARVAGPDPLRQDHAGVRPVLWRTTAAVVAREPRLREELLGPSIVVAMAVDVEGLLNVVGSLPGQLSATIHAGPGDDARVAALLPDLEERAGRILFGGFPTGVEISHATQHGGPWPATSDARFTSVGPTAIARFLRPVCWQDAPQDQLPPELRDDNPGGIPRLVDGRPER
ncbi:MAG: aldehyde dehydrogenase (NADP(+)) [Myxococcales bacterium]|nr:aldehyde dehydrogenase (NADP(+)) [Myxococcales bacterium]